MPAYTIRRVAADDLPEWLRMRKLLWPRADAAGLEKDLGAMLRDPMTPVFVVARADGGLCGLLEAGTRPYADGCDTSPVAYIEGWFVDEDVRGQGIGRALVAEAEGWARAQGLHEMASDTALANEVGLRAHLALGYNEIERAIHFAKKL